MSEPPVKPELYIPHDVPATSVAVLVSGGVESAALTARLTSCFDRVYPVYVRFGLSWERVEEAYLRLFLNRIASVDPRVAATLAELKTIELPVWDVYGSHWSTTGKAVPDRSTEDEAVFLPGRNVLLVAKTAVWCSLQGVSTLALGHLQSNPFPDATAGFFDDLARIMITALDTSLRIIRPFANLAKEEVLRLSADLPLELTFSCISPVQVSTDQHVHCGQCNKCEERKRGFAQARLPDTTVYASAAEKSRHG